MTRLPRADVTFRDLRLSCRKPHRQSAETRATVALHYPRLEDSMPNPRIEPLKKVLAIDPNDDVAWFGLGKAYMSRPVPRTLEKQSPTSSIRGWTSCPHLRLSRRDSSSGMRSSNMYPSGPLSERGSRSPWSVKCWGAPVDGLMKCMMNLRHGSRICLGSHRTTMRMTSRSSSDKQRVPHQPKAAPRGPFSGSNESSNDSEVENAALEATTHP